jgi:hypothetical protein
MFLIVSECYETCFVFGNPTSKMEGQKATWNYGLGYGANYFTMSNGSASIFPQFVPNHSAQIFPQFLPNQSSPIFPKFPTVDNNFLRQSRTRDVCGF